MRGGTILDPICDMVVDLNGARQDGLAVEYGEREYGFCSAGCKVKFANGPSAYVRKVDAWLANGGDSHDGGSAHAHDANSEVLVIDDGIRAWYKSCRCCLSDAHPQIVEALDRERAAMAQTPVDAGICETAESHGT